MRVCVTGATGFIGRALIPVLRREGHTVVAWVRSEARARSLLGAEVETADAGGGLEGLIRVLERCDAMRRPDRFRELLLACECDARGRLNKEDEPYPQRPRLQTAMEAALGADTAAVASHAIARGLSGPAIGAAVHAARVHAVAASLSDAA